MSDRSGSVRGGTVGLPDLAESESRQGCNSARCTQTAKWQDGNRELWVWSRLILALCTWEAGLGQETDHGFPILQLKIHRYRWTKTCFLRVLISYLLCMWTTKLDKQPTTINQNLQKPSRLRWRLSSYGEAGSCPVCARDIWQLISWHSKCLVSYSSSLIPLYGTDFEGPNGVQCSKWRQNILGQSLIPCHLAAHLWPCKDEKMKHFSGKWCPIIPNYSKTLLRPKGCEEEEQCTEASLPFTFIPTAFALFWPKPV